MKSTSPKGCVSNTHLEWLLFTICRALPFDLQANFTGLLHLCRKFWIKMAALLDVYKAQSFDLGNSTSNQKAGSNLWKVVGLAEGGKSTYSYSGAVCICSIWKKTNVVGLIPTAVKRDSCQFPYRSPSHNHSNLDITAYINGCTT